jgi:hypothetical protein
VKQGKEITFIFPAIVLLGEAWFGMVWQGKDSQDSTVAKV